MRLVALVIVMSGCVATDHRKVHVTWTIDGASPAGATCNLTITFSNGNYKDDFGYEPLPCAEGEFTLTSVDTSFDSVELGLIDGPSQTRSIGDDGTVNFDLQVTLHGP